ncbi:TPA: hypothetical protein MXD69_001436 [Klebsiella variicola]|nr:hypothetical protein [Klebsiella pneumoniae]HDK6237508.1 hypothetical protein [Klebsiella variicola]
MSEVEKGGGNGLVDFLGRQLYNDVKLIIPYLFRKLTIPTKKAIAKRYKSPEELLDGLKCGHVKDGDFIAIECKPSTFGPFLRSHVLSVISCTRSDMHLGPQLISDHPEFPEIETLMVQSTSYLKPVGLYPPIDDNISQITLFPSDATCCGFIGLRPDVRNLITSIPAIVSQNKISLCGAPSVVIGIVRTVTQSMFQDKGISLETYEELRQAGDAWYLDIISEGTEIKPMFDGVVTEMWGGIYASGHIEIEGEIQIQSLIDGVFDVFKNAGFEPFFHQNMVASKEFTVLSRGLRFTIYPFGCIYSLHMDAELAINYKASRSVFDDICDNLLSVILESAKKHGAKIKNPKDLDFTYTDAAKSFSILESKTAGLISDPISIVVRDWHRKKNAK